MVDMQGPIHTDVPPHIYEGDTALTGWPPDACVPTNTSPLVSPPPPSSSAALRYTQLRLSLMGPESQETYAAVTTSMRFARFSSRGPASRYNYYLRIIYFAPERGRIVMVLRRAVLCLPPLPSSLPSLLPVLLFLVPGSRSEPNSLGRIDRVRGRGEVGGGSSDLQIIYLRLASA